MRGFTTFAGAVLGCAPDSHIEVLLSGIGALTDELKWFRTKAEQRGIQLHNTGAPVCRGCPNPEVAGGQCTL